METIEETNTEVKQTETEQGFFEVADVLFTVGRVGYFHLVRKSGWMTSKGDAVSVSLKQWWDDIEKRDEEHGDVAGVFHTHPPDSEYLSSIDTAAAQAFAFCLGKEMLMIVETDTGWYAGWWVDDEEVVTSTNAIKLPFGFFLVYSP